MAPAKRKRPHDEPEPPIPAAATAAAATAVAAGATTADPTTTRRATRQTPILPPPIPTSATASHPQPLHPSTAAAGAAEDKRISGRRPSNSKPYPASKISETPIPIPVPPTSSSASHLPQQQQQQQQQQLSIPRAAGQPATPAPQETRVTRQRRESANANDSSSPKMAFKDAKENVRPVTLVAPKITYQAPQTQAHRNRTGGSLVRPSPPTSQPPITQHFRPISSTTTTTTTTTTRPSYHHTIPATVTAVPVPVHPTSTSTASKPAPAAAAAPPPPPVPPPRTADKSAPRTDRNIDKVMLGNICFRAWYPSYYGKEVLGEAAGAKAGGGGSKNPLAHDAASATNNGNGNGGAKNQHRKGGDALMLDRLYVCPMCFKYSKELVAWWGHVRMCERNGVVPGRKVYRHPRGRRLVRKEIARTTGKKTNVAPKYTEEYVTDEGEWSVWEVDGEQDVLFCQNLSLFAKLFLDNKSVFFDVRGFNYFLLVYTPPAPKPNPSSQQDSTATATATAQPPQPPASPPRPHIVGFFSKEKMSWDNNNLACILVFPPWQKKGLGALLMGVSYEISRREGVLGGPEKPISELGRKGYKRFWGGEIARWILGCPSNGRVAGDADPALLVDLEDCSRATWIALDDCLATLREMGVVVEAGRGPGKPPAKKKKKAKKIAGEDGADEEAVEEEDEEDEDVEMEDADAGPRPDVPRVKVNKALVWEWVAANGISLERICDPEGFVEGYAIKQPDVEEEDD